VALCATCQPEHELPGTSSSAPVPRETCPGGASGAGLRSRNKFNPATLTFRLLRGSDASLSQCSLVGWRRNVLIQPGFGERLAVSGQEQSQIDRLQTVIRERQVEHCTPSPY
jgi:hypothetical protein